MKRYRVFLIVAGLAFLVLLSRFFYLQVLLGRHFREKSEHNCIQILRDVAPRGAIRDRNGEILVDNRPSFCVSIIPWLARRRMEETLESLAGVIDIDVSKVKAKIEGQRFRPFQPISLAEDLSPRAASRVLQCQMDFHGVVMQPRPWRSYPRGKLCAHILGYTQEINEGELEIFGGKGYGQGDHIGRSGIERTCEAYLRGIDGGTEIEVDVLGRPARAPRVLARKDPVKGADVVLTIDGRIQEFCEKALGWRAGAIVVLDPSSGEVLAMASNPDYHPEMFTSTIPRHKWERMLAGRRHPFLNRAIQGNYPPASVFKIIVAAAALENGTVDIRDEVECEGKIYLGRRPYKCWKKHGRHVDFKRGIAESCDVYFYQLGLKVGPDAMAEYARHFGLGVAAGIDIEGEKRGLVPSPDWKKEARGERWFTGDSFNYAIGQGYILCTPLQVANMMCAIFNGGKLYRPHLIKEVRSRDGKSVKFKYGASAEVPLKPSTFSMLQECMKEVVKKGTGRLADVPHIDVAGKTGTAQNPFGKSHAWFVCHASPRQGESGNGMKSLVICVFVENGGEGGAVACPIAARILRAIYKKKG